MAGLTETGLYYFDSWSSWPFTVRFQLAAAPLSGLRILGNTKVFRVCVSRARARARASAFFALRSVFFFLARFRNPDLGISSFPSSMRIPPRPPAFCIFSFARDSLEISAAEVK